MTHPTQKLLSALEDRECSPRQNGSGWSARCPAHDDHRPSLSISESDDGHALLRCHAGCTIDSICDSLGLQVADLMPDLSSAPAPTELREKRKKQKFRRQKNGKLISSKPTYKTLKAVINFLECKLGTMSDLWAYQDTASKTVGMIIRWDTDSGKEFRPITKQGDRWIIGGMPEPRPLYCLPELANADRVFIIEGEKAADAAHQIGLRATTSAHGSQSPEKTDWSPLAGKECVILSDNDDSGRKYANKVEAILANLTPPASVRVVELPGLPNHGDIVDWIDSQPNMDPSELRRQVELLADEAKVIQPGQSTSQIEQFQPFPTDALPEPLCGFVKAGAKAIGCDESFLVLPLLSALGAAIGNTRRLRLKLNWAATPIIWTAIVGESGTSKTPALNLVMKPICNRQSKAMRKYADAMRQYETDLVCYDKALSAWKRKKNSDDSPPEKPDLPQAERILMGDTTVEALVSVLQANPRGILTVCDELAGWFGSFDKYTSGKGGTDVPHWLSMFEGGNMTVDRKTGNPRTIFIEQASVSVTGGIQPAILNRALGTRHRESGLAARLLLACPPRIAKRWTEDDVDSEVDSEFAQLIDSLYDFQPTFDDEGKPKPIVIGLTPEAKSEFTEFYNQHAEELSDHEGDLAAAWSKLEGYAARLALIIHCVRCAAGDPTLQNQGMVDLESMQAGIVMTQWFKNETRRVYAMFSESTEERERRNLIQWIDRNGGAVTARMLQQGNRNFRKSHAAEDALQQLVKNGYGEWDERVSGPKGGRPTRVFRLSLSAK